MTPPRLGRELESASSRSHRAGAGRSKTKGPRATKPAKNLPVVVRSQIRHCMPVIGTIATAVPSPQAGAPSM